MMVLTPWATGCPCEPNFSVEVLRIECRALGRPRALRLLASLLWEAWGKCASRAHVVSTALLGWRAWLAVLRPVSEGTPVQISA